MKITKTSFITFLFVMTMALSYGQKENTSSETRKFMYNADFTQVNRDWNTIAEFKSGIGEVVSFYTIEVIDLKTNQKIKSLQMDMTVDGGKIGIYSRSSWIDLSEVDEFIYFIEHYVIPNLKDKTEDKKSVTYLYNSKEITFSFYIEKNLKRISIYLKDDGIIEDEHYFWTETQVNKITDLLNFLKQIK